MDDDPYPPLIAKALEIQILDPKSGPPPYSMGAIANPKSEVQVPRNHVKGFPLSWTPFNDAWAWDDPKSGPPPVIAPAANGCRGSEVQTPPRYSQQPPTSDHHLQFEFGWLPL